MWRHAVAILVLTGCWVSLARGDNESTPRPAQPEAKFRVERNIVYSKVGDKELLLDAFLPAGDKQVPAVLVVHGGAWRSGNKAQLRRYAELLAEHGYAAFAINYRLAPQFKYPAQIEDCRSAVRWIRAHAKEYHVDPNRLGAIGYSAGGHLVALLGAQGDQMPDCRVQCVVAGGAPVDFRAMKTESKAVSEFLGGPRQEKQKVYDDASPISHVNAGDPPIFFYHGTKDELVKLDGVESMVELLRSAKVPAELFKIKDAGHIPAAMSTAAIDEAIRFFDRYLKPESRDKST